MTLTDEQLAEARRLADAATSGTWIQDVRDTAYVRRGPTQHQTIASCNLSHHDAAFIAASRTLVPALLDLVDAHHAEIDLLREELITTRAAIVVMAEHIAKEQS